MICRFRSSLMRKERYARGMMEYWNVAGRGEWQGWQSVPSPCQSIHPSFLYSLTNRKFVYRSPLSRDYSVTAATVSFGPGWTSSSPFEQHSSPSEQHALPSSVEHSLSPALHSAPASPQQVLASPEQHLSPSEQQELWADAAASGQPPAEQASSSPSEVNEAKLAMDGDWPPQQPSDSALAREAWVEAAPDFEQQEPPVDEEAAERLDVPEQQPLSTPFCARRIPAVTANAKAKVTGKRARIMLGPSLKEKVCVLVPELPPSVPNGSSWALLRGC